MSKGKNDPRWFRWRCANPVDKCSHEFDTQADEFPGCNWCGNKTGLLLSIRVGYYGPEAETPRVPIVPLAPPPSEPLPWGFPNITCRSDDRL